MTGPHTRGPIALRDVLLASIAAAVVLSLGLFGTHRSRLLELERRSSADEAVLADVATRVTDELDRLLAAAAELAHNAGAVGAAVPRGFVASDPAADVPSEPVLSVTDRANPDVTAVLDRTRDTGEVALGRSIDLGEGPRPLIVAPIYASGAADRPLGSTVDRRAQITGWVVEPVDLAELVGSALSAGQVGTISDGRANALVGAAEAPAGLPERTLDSHGHQFVIRAGDASGVPIGGSTLALALSTLGVAAAAAFIVIDASRRLRAERRDAADRAAQIRLIGDIGPLVQQSLDLADVLPSIAVQLSDHFELAGVSLSTLASGGAAVILFSFGDAPAPGAKAVLRPPEDLAAGSTLVLALERGGRSVAQLRLVAGRDLDGAELQSLRAITELITAAVANASLYASQQDAMARLRDLDALKTGFLGTASHELRTPVTAISGFATLLEESWERFDEEQRRHFVERIGANARSLTAVVQDLLDFSLLDRGTIVLALEAVDLGTLARSVVDRLGPLFGDHEIVFTAAPAPEVAGDVNGLERVISNLLTNAVKFSPPDTTVTVTVGPSTKPGYGAEIEVCDQGRGVPPEERQHVFTRFFRGSGEEVLRTRGVGIGLSVVAEFVALLNGDVEVGDAPSGGARFTLHFPESVVEDDALEAAHAPTA